MSRVRVYHPETDEPFDLPEAKANDLILNQGWRKQPIDPGAEPAVRDVPTGAEGSSPYFTTNEDAEDTEDTEAS